MNHRDIAVLMDGIAPVLRGYVEKAFEPIGARMTVIERSLAELSAAPRDPDPVVILRLVEETVAKIPPAEPGKDGKDADPELVAELVNKAVAALEPAKDGEPGPAGESVTVEQLTPLVADTVAKAVSREMEKIAANLPIGKDGAPGRDGRDGLPGVQGEKGADGRHGVDGKDGLGIDDFDVKSLDDGRVLEFSLRREGAEPIVRTVDLATVLDRGVWSEKAYAKGDGVTWGGSFFIAQRATEAADKPGISDGWRLAVKRGRDGKEGKPGPQGEKGLKGDPGTPGRNYG